MPPEPPNKRPTTASTTAFGSWPEPPPLPAIPDHTLIRKIAAGGYGEIWLARNIMGSLRAVKFLFRKRFEHDRPYEREYEGIQRFEPISRSHEGFVDILHMGRNDTDGYFYYVMELGDDREHGQNCKPEDYQPKTLASEIISRGRLPVEECLHLALVLTDALRQLHETGLTHRDIKPSNIIFVNGTPKLADIGLVADIGHDRSYVGTEGFIAPEGPGTPQADLFSLGKVLYEISTGKDRTEFPELPEDFDTFPDAAAFRELNEVVIRACHASLPYRYASASKMYAELAVIINGESIKRLRQLERKWAYVRYLGWAALLVVLLGGVVSFPLYREYKMRQAEYGRQVGVSITEGAAAMKAGNLPQALAAFATALQLTEGQKFREEDNRLRCAATFAQCPKLVQMAFATSAVTSVEFHPTQKRVLVTQDRKRISVLAYAGNGLLAPVSTKTVDAGQATFSPDGQSYATAGHDSRVNIWNAVTGDLIQSLPHSNTVNCVQFSPDGKLLLTGTDAQEAYLWSKEGRLLAQFNGHHGEVQRVCFSPDQRLAATACNDGYARVWDLATPQKPRFQFKHANWVLGLDFSPDGKFLATSGFDNQAHVWNLSDGHEVLPAMPHNDGIRRVKFSPDGRYFLTASVEGMVRLWQTATHQPIASNSSLQNSDRVNDAAFNPEGNKIIIGGNDGTVRIWDFSGVAMGTNSAPLFVSAEGGQAVAIVADTIQIRDAYGVTELPLPFALRTGLGGLQMTRDSRWLVGFSRNTNPEAHLLIWDLKDKNRAPRSLPCPAPINRLYLSPGSLAACVFQDNQLMIFDVPTARPLGRNLAFKSEISQALFNHDTSRLYVSAERELWTLDPRTGQSVAPNLEFPFQLQGIAFNPREQSFIACLSTPSGEECFARRHDTASRRVLGQPMRHRDSIMKAVYSPDGAKIATGSDDFTARVWDAKTGRPLTAPLPHGHQVTDVAFSPDSRWLLTVSIDQKARLWEASSGEPLAPPIAFPLRLFYGRFLADGCHLLVGRSAFNESIALPGYGYWHITYPSDRRPTQDWRDIATLLAGSAWTSQQADDQEAPEIRRRKLQATWIAMKAKYPKDFATSDHDSLRWHEQETMQAETEENWRAVQFHLDWIHKLDSDSAFYLQHQAILHQVLSSANSAGDFPR